MATFGTALSNLAALSVDGMRGNYGIDALPERLTSGHLPALLVLPLELEKEGLFRERKEGIEAVAFSGKAKTVAYSLTHMLALAPTDRGLGMRSHLPRLVGLIDSYVEAIAEDITLGEALLVPARVAVEAGVFAYGGRDYYGCAFRHTWLMEI